ncbi:MAG: hypothetical protein ABIK73_07270 [candidate division WOR-3 bacterium]
MPNGYALMSSSHYLYKTCMQFYVGELDKTEAKKRILKHVINILHLWGDL